MKSAWRHRIHIVLVEMLFLFETSAGYALFSMEDSKLKSVDSVDKCFTNSDVACKQVNLKAFSKFEDTAAALSAASAVMDGSLDKGLKKFLKKNIVKAKLGDTLAVADGKLGGLIKDELSIPCVHDKIVDEVFRGIRMQLDTLLTGMPEQEYGAMKLGLSHSLCRYTLKFSPEKVDTMIVQAIALLDELDKELNTYAMRVKEWYGWHFPEMSKIVGDNAEFAKVVKAMGLRSNASTADLSAIGLEEDVEARLRAAAEISMGTEIAQEDVINIQFLCDQVLTLTEYRASLYAYLCSRMNAVAPNLSVMVGELVGARLIAHTGSLMNLAKHPASTVQILGAEKALFRALKTKHATPKYGLIFHASLVGQSSTQNKGKISRVLAAKTALAVRVDALGDADEATIGYEARQAVERRLQQLEGNSVRVSPVKGTPQKAHQFASKTYGLSLQLDFLTLS